MSTICDVNNLGSSNMSHAIACANESIFGHELENINYKPSPVKHAYECTTITYDVLTAMFLLYVNVPYRSKCITNDVLTAMFLLYVYVPYRSKCITNDVLTAMFLLYVYGPYRSKCNPS
jgi:hypothetical protein